MEPPNHTPSGGRTGIIRIHLLAHFVLTAACMIAIAPKATPAPIASPIQSGANSTGFTPLLRIDEDPSLRSNNDQMAEAVRRRMLAKFAVQRHEKIHADTERLITLAHALQSEVRESHDSNATASELKKVETIEKLARRVKQNMAPE